MRLTVGMLRKAMDGLPDDAPVVLDVPFPAQVSKPPRVVQIPARYRMSKSDGSFLYLETDFTKWWIGDETQPEPRELK